MVGYLFVVIYKISQELIFRIYTNYKDKTNTRNQVLSLVSSISDGDFFSFKYEKKIKKPTNVKYMVLGSKTEFNGDVEDSLSLHTFMTEERFMIASSYLKEITEFKENHHIKTLIAKYKAWILYEFPNLNIIVDDNQEEMMIKKLDDSKLSEIMIDTKRLGESGHTEEKSSNVVIMGQSVLTTIEKQESKCNEKTPSHASTNVIHLENAGSPDDIQADEYFLDQKHNAEEDLLNAILSSEYAKSRNLSVDGVSYNLKNLVQVFENSTSSSFKKMMLNQLKNSDFSDYLCFGNVKIYVFI